MGRDLQDRFPIQMTPVSSPGVIFVGWLGDLELMIEGLGIDDFGLADRFMEDGVG